MVNLRKETAKSRAPSPGKLRRGTFEDVALTQRDRCRTRLRAAGVFLMAILTLSFAGAQNLVNSGAINNVGTIRVKGQASGLPAAVDGVFEYSGANQNVPATQYKNLKLMGSGTKTTTGGNFSVSQNITIKTAVTFKVQTGASITLIGNLLENGYLSGSIRNTEDLSGVTTSSNFGNIGATISWTGTALGTTTVNRVSGIASNGNGNVSILRYYDVAPTFNTGLNSTLVLQYANNELNGLDPNTLELWRTVDGGATWRRQGGTVDITQHTITKTGVRSFSRWTASDVAHPLGTADLEWVAKNLAMTSGNSGTGTVSTAVPAFVVNVKDAFGNAISGVTVTFAITTIPSGATGQSLSTTTVLTDANGQASTSLTLGNVAGTYSVSAASAGLVGSPLTFSATATAAAPPPSAATALTLITGNNQSGPILAPLASPMTVKVINNAGTGVSNVPVTFAIIESPTNAVGPALSVQSIVTNANGEASTMFTVGNKTGTYRITASSNGLAGSPIAFTVNGTHGAVTTILLRSGDGQSGLVRTPLAGSLTVTVLDAGNNTIPDETIRWSITETPTDASGQVLSTTTSRTDPFGIASINFTLGSAAGSYTISAQSDKLPGSVVQFHVSATSALATQLTLTSGNNQSGQVASRLSNPFVVTVLDASNNPVQGVNVIWTIASTPNGATSQALTVVNGVTDNAGRSSASLTLGNKVGQYTVSATTNSIPGTSATFQSQAVVGSAALLVKQSGDGQSGGVQTQLQNPFVVTITDNFGNPVSGAIVTWAITQIPSGSIGQLLSSTVTTTDATGTTSTVLTLGNKSGLYKITSTLAGVATAEFTAQGKVVIGDINRDQGINIADLTTVIDHILGKIKLTGIDSVAADVNGDGIINLRDVVLIKSYLLGDSTSLQKSGSAVPEQANSLSAVPMTASVHGEFEATKFGIRFNMENDVRVNGIQLIIRFKNILPSFISGVDVIFDRAKMMEMPMSVGGRELRFVAFNEENIPIQAGRGAIFRLPSAISNINDIESVEFVVSIGQGIHQALQGPVQTVMQTSLPTLFKLEQNYPNPFNPSTIIQFEVPDNQAGSYKVALEVYNQLGQLVTTLVNKEMNAGVYKAIWNGTDDSGTRVASGMYYYQLRSNDYKTAKKMLMLR